jgi:hypothetical protein
MWLRLYRPQANQQPGKFLKICPQQKLFGMPEGLKI